MEINNACFAGILLFDLFCPDAFGILVTALHTLIYHIHSINLDILIDILHIAMPGKSCKKKIPTGAI